jgi:internalin A
LRNVRSLDLSANSVLQSLDGISSLTFLEWLDVSGNALTEFNGELITLHWLQHLDLSNNKITSLPDNFGQLR